MKVEVVLVEMQSVSKLEHKAMALVQILEWALVRTQELALEKFPNAAHNSDKDHQKTTL